MSRGRWTLAAAALGVVAALLSTRPLMHHMVDSIPTPYPDCAYMRCADELLCTWIVGEGGRRLYRHPLDVFEANILHPLHHTLAFSESMLSAGALVAPINALTGNPILGYDLYYLASVALSVLGGFLLVREITGDARAGLLAGWFFALMVERWDFRGLLPAIAVQWVPFVFYTWTRFLDAPGRWRGVALVAALAAHIHAGAYNGLMLPVLLVPWALVLLAGPWPLRRWLAGAAVAGAAAGASLALFLPYLAVRNEVQYQPKEMFSTWSVHYWGALVAPRAYLASLFSGSRAAPLGSPLPLVLLALAAAVVCVRRPAVARPRAEATHLAAMLVFLVAAMAVSLGPKMTVGSLFRGVTGPFYYLAQLPGFGSIRAPLRFTLLVGFGSSVLVGIAAAAMLRRLRSPVAAAVLVVVLGAVILVDSRTLEEPQPLTRLIPPSEVPPVYRWLATTPEDTAVLELPYGGWGTDARYMVLSLYHGRRMMNGYTALMPRFLQALGGFPDEVSIRTLQDAGVRYVIAHGRDLVATRGGREQLARALGRSDLGPRAFGDDLVLTIPPGPPPREPAGEELDRTRWRLEGSDPGAELAADGDLATEWTGRIDAHESFLRVDLGAEEEVTAVGLGLGPHIREYPRAYRVLASRDGTSWETIGEEQPTLPPLASYRRDHLAIEVALEVRPTTARWLEIRVPLESPTNFSVWGLSPGYWAVHELRVRAARRPAA